MNNNYYGDFHTHTKYSDGAGTVETNVKSAIEANLKAVAITDHGFSNPKRFSLRFESYLKQREEIIAARKKYPQIEILHGVEADIIGTDGTIDMTDEQCEHTDILVAGFHRFAKPKSRKDFFELYFNANTYLPKYFAIPSPKKLAQNTDAVIKMIERYPIDILAHLNSCLITDGVEVAKACAELGVLLELNVKHFNLLERDFDKLMQTDVLFIASSDAHASQKIGQFQKIDDFLSARSVDLSRIVNIGDKRPIFRRDKNKIMSSK